MLPNWRNPSVRRVKPSTARRRGPPACRRWRTNLEPLQDHTAPPVPDLTQLAQQPTGQLHTVQSALHTALDTAASIPILGKQIGDNPALNNVVSQFDQIASRIEQVQSQIQQAA